jgi:hypothetical protein
MKSTRFLALLAAAVLAGCATSYTVDNTVQSFSHISALPAPATYRFDRLPSQQNVQQAQLEAMADTALNAVGLRRDDTRPRYAVQVNASVAQTLSPWADPWTGGWGWGAWGGRRRWGVGFGTRAFEEPPWYHREVNVVVRELSNNQVVYESRAISDGPYSDTVRILPAMFSAAMQGFPNPPAGPRKVDVQIAG